MKLLTLSFLLMIMCLVSVAQNKPSPGASRIEKKINSNWTFNYFPAESAEKGYESASYDDSKWIAVSIPHTWSTYETTGEIHPFLMNTSEILNPYWWNGWGWYRKHFSINQSFQEKKVFIELEGVQKYCKVWINGVYLGDHKGGYGSFDFDITSHIKKGGDNVIAVAVSNKKNDKFRIPPMGSENINVYGGIFRDVTLVLKNKLYIPMQGSASHEGGTCITTPELTEKSGIVRIQTWVKNDDSQNRDCTLQTTIIDASGKTVQVVKTTAQVKAGELYRFDQLTKPVKPPHLWSPDDPYVYKVVSEVLDGKNITDIYTSTFGFRWYRWDYKENSLYLNGSKIVLHGSNRKQEYPWLGAAIPDWILLTDYSDFSKNRDYNFIRTIDFPHDKMVYDLTDRSGIIVNEGFPDINNQEFAPEVRDQQLREMIRRDRNHPSILFWSMGMEKSLSEDTTRLVTAGKGNASESRFASIENALISATATGDGGNTQLLTSSGEPAKIILRTVRPEITADRGSVSVIQADIVDSKGNHVHGANNILNWNVTGPARLVSPPVYEPNEVWYAGVPVLNVIRSTGEPGKIAVMVSAAGLASGFIEINVKAETPDNSVITEPVLKNDNRTGVQRIVLQPLRLEETPKEIGPATTDIILTATDKPGYIKASGEFIKKNNPQVDTATAEFRTFARLLGTYLFNNGGKASAGDYNFNAAHFNMCRIIDGYISATKLPESFKEGLRNYYAELIIVKGKEVNAGDEMNWLNWIPSGGIVVFCTDNPKLPAPKGIVYTNRNELPEIISIVYPDFTKFSEDGKTRAIEFIDKMNPYVNAVTENKTVDGKMVASTRLIAEKGKPILIPLYKFIAE